MDKEVLKQRISVKSQKLSQKQQQVVESFQSRAQEDQQRVFDNIWSKFQKSEASLKRKDDAIGVLLKQHKQDIDKKFEKQRELEEKEKEK